MIPSERSVLLEAHQVSYTYGSFHALTEVSLELQAGQLAALIGRNGAGKSTLLQCLAGWAHVTGGKVALLGHSLERQERAARAAVILVPDTPSFYEALTAWEHLQFVAQARRLDDWRDRAEKLLRRFGLHAQRDAFPQAFSRGMRYKLALCMALLAEPPLLLLDEPFGPLDPLAAEHLWRDLAAHRRRGGAVLLSGHQLPAGAEADQYWVLEEGEIIARGTPRQLRESLEVVDLSLDTLLRAALEARLGSDD